MQRILQEIISKDFVDCFTVDKMRLKEHPMPIGAVYKVSTDDVENREGTARKAKILKLPMRLDEIHAPACKLFRKNSNLFAKISTKPNDRVQSVGSTLDTSASQCMRSGAQMGHFHEQKWLTMGSIASSTGANEQVTFQSHSTCTVIAHSL